MKKIILLDHPVSKEVIKKMKAECFVNDATLVDSKFKKDFKPEVIIAHYTSEGKKVGARKAVEKTSD